MLIVNIPLLCGWGLLYFGSSLTHVFIGMTLLGLGVGLMESPILTYVGEIWLVLIRLYRYSSKKSISSDCLLIVQ